MKKNNDVLKDALRQAAQLELDTLPKENQIIRPYSDKFEKDMSSLLSESTSAETRKRPRVRVAALIAAVLVVCMTLTVGAAGFRIFSPDWRESIQEAAKNATYSDEVAEFDEAFAKADDYFANLTRETEGADNLLLDYSESYDIDVTAEKDGYKFYVDRIVKGYYKTNKVVNGSISKGDVEFRWVVEEGYFLITEVSRTDGKKLTADGEDVWFNDSLVVAGYNPGRIQACLRGGYGIGEREDYVVYNVMEITDALVFAEHDFGLVFTSNEDCMMIDYETVYIDENGLPAFRDNVDCTNLVVKFNIDKKFADEVKVQACVKEYDLDRNLDLYKK